jgi:hypothetical protein
MKTVLSFALFCLFTIFFMVCCQKEDTAKDYRAAFTGTYAAKETTTCYGAMGNCYHESDSIIYVIPGDSDSTILVLGRMISIATDGIYTAYHYGLQFRSDSIFSNLMVGGLGGGTYVKHVGKRISKKVN